jgi:glycosyltransferase involved in cell wall biosynthesis
VKTAISCAFNENAIWALSRYASSHGLLSARLVPNWNVTTDAARLASRLLRSSDSLARFVSRKQANFLESQLAEDVPISRLTEFIRIAGGRIKTPLTPYIGFFAWKAEFDRRASLALDGADIDVLIGMPGSSERTFSRHVRPLKVFHATDSHPRARNLALEQAYGRAGRHEAYPRALVNRIDRELGLSDVVLTPSRQTAQGMVEHGVSPDKIVTIPYGVDLHRFNTTRSESIVSEHRRPRLLYVGQISRLKGIPLLLDAVRGLDADLTVVGQVFDRSALNNIPSNVHLAGTLSSAEVSHAYNTHDALVLPTLNDAFALVLVEAAACGLQVVTTRVAGAVDVLPSQSLVVPPNNVDALRDALSSIKVLPAEEYTYRAAHFRADAGTRMKSWDGYAERVFDELTQRMEIRRSSLMPD